MKNLIKLFSILSVVIVFAACGGTSSNKMVENSEKTDQFGVSEAMGFEADSETYTFLEGREWISQTFKNRKIVFKNERMFIYEDGRLSQEGMFVILKDCDSGEEDVAGNVISRVMGMHADNWKFELSSDYNTLTLTDCKTNEKEVLKEGT